MPTKNKRKKRKVIRFRPFKTRFKKKHWNLGTVTFGIIFIYLMVNFIMYLNEDTLSTYEVTKNSMEKTITTKGLVLRDETIIKNKADGYLNYYAQEGMHKKGNVFENKAMSIRSMKQEKFMNIYLRPHPKKGF